MKSIKTNPNSAKGPDKGKIVSKSFAYYWQHLSFLIIFFSKKPDMKFIILFSNLKEISPSVFSWKKEYIKNYDAILLLKYDSSEKRY
jgi:NifB/MoaA-like Fe-S oxidoreductase